MYLEIGEAQLAYVTVSGPPPDENAPGWYPGVALWARRSGSGAVKFVPFWKNRSNSDHA